MLQAIPQPANHQIWISSAPESWGLLEQKYMRSEIRNGDSVTEPQLNEQPEKTTSNEDRRSEARIILPIAVRYRATQIFAAGFLAVAMIMELRLLPSANADEVVRSVVPLERTLRARAQAWQFSQPISLPARAQLHG